jgi:aspartate racemase
MNLKNIKKIGILDGMGAFAGARFFQMILEKITRENLPFPEIILNAVSLDDFISDQSKIVPAQKILSSRVRAFNNQNVSMIVMACNTAHILHPKLSSISKAPFPSLIDLVVHQAVIKDLKNIGILASPITIKTKLYENALINAGLVPFIPNRNFQDFLEKIIRDVISNSVIPSEIRHFELKTRIFIFQHHLDGLILGCTELPLAFPKSKFNHIKILDSLEILADSVVDHLKC